MKISSQATIQNLDGMIILDSRFRGNDKKAIFEVMPLMKV